MADIKIEARPWQPQDLIDDLQRLIDEEPDRYLNDRRTTLCTARDYLKEYFATDVAPVVRCKDCKHSIRGLCYHEQWESLGVPCVDDNDFCSYGERRADNG